MTEAARPLPEPDLRYKRSKFSTRLPLERLYTQGHLWLWGHADGVWRIGFTKFALRMLGDPVEFDFEAPAGGEVATGDVLGWVEGFKAVSDVFSPLDGVFEGHNPELEDDIALLHKAPYDRGWLFGVRGEPDPSLLEAQGYADLLDATIDRMLGASS